MSMLASLYPPLDWQAQRAQWPHSAHSTFVSTPAMRWHVQRMGEGPVLVLVHGTGASTHTWRDVMPLLAAHFHVVAVDLPGHGFSDPLRHGVASLPAVAQALRDVLTQLNLQPDVWMGHSAGAAIAARCSIDEVALDPARRAHLRLVAINPAWLPLSGASQWLFPLAAWLIELNPLSGWLAAKRASRPGVIDDLLASTGSRIDEAGLRGYRYLLSQPRHVRGVLQLMAAWDLHSFSRDLHRLTIPVRMQIGSQDRTISPAQAELARGHLPHAEVHYFAQLGHLLHEEAPASCVHDALAWLGRE